jgi:D-alanine-D-alanine ligase
MKIVVIYNEPQADRYHSMGESKAELGVMDEVKAVGQALVDLKYTSVMLPLRPPLSQVKKELTLLKKQNIDVIFNLFEGFDGSPETEGSVAGMLEEMGLAFTGCPAQALTLALDKSRTKEILETARIPTPRFQILTPESLSSFQLDFPCFVKPVSDDASHGISEESVVYSPDDLEKQIRKISHLFDGKALVEEYVDGREFNTTVMGNKRLIIPAISEIVYTLPLGKPKILTFEAKWEEKSVYYENTKAHCPADISPKEQDQISRIAKASFKLTGCRGYARVDFRQDQAGRFKVLEVNPNPDISPGAGASLQGAAAGMSYNRFIEKIIRFALK